jgi:hypothetical protein
LRTPSANVAVAMANLDRLPNTLETTWFAKTSKHI